MIAEKDISHLWGQVIIEELVRLGCDHFCIAPGARSAPLTLAVAKNKRTLSTVHFDERGLSFFALGLSRGIKKPACIIVTSGTAIANLMPAVVEASMQMIPLIILSGDRPFELLKSGANQAIDQVKFFGSYCKYEINIPPASQEIPLKKILTQIDYAAFLSTSLNKGPVHINCNIKEPLETHNNYKLSYAFPIKNWLVNNKPNTCYAAKKIVLSKKELTKIANIINKAKNGLIIVGALYENETRNEMVQFCKSLMWPTVADITSGLRFCDHNFFVHNIDDRICRNHDFNFDIILQFGGRLTSKKLENFLVSQACDNYIMVENGDQLLDPHSIITNRIQTDISWLIKNILPLLRTNIRNKKLEIIKNADNKLKEVKAKDIANTTKLTQQFVVNYISKKTESSRGLFISNSLPIRYINEYAAQTGAMPALAYNRGASGIDGILASGVGFATGIKRATTILIGDLSFLHDLNSLCLYVKSNIPIIIVLINNSGGQIFSTLPISKNKKIMSKFFTANHNYSFKNFAKEFKITYHLSQSRKQFIKQYSNALLTKKHNLIEVKI